MRFLKVSSLELLASLVETMSKRDEGFFDVKEGLVSALFDESDLFLQVVLGLSQFLLQRTEHIQLE